MTTAVLSSMTIPAATLAAAIGLGALFAPPAVRAGGYCSLDVDFMRNCSFSAMERCKAAASGVNGECSPNPFLKDNSIATIDRDAYAYAPRPIHREHTGRAAKANK
jgi:Protein of unknown function (DUF3551)